MIENQYSAQLRRIHAFSIAWAKAKLGPGLHRPMAIAVKAHPVGDYAVNWLAQHDEMPTGVHIKRATRGLHSIHTDYLPHEVDFTPLHRLASSGKRQPQPQAAGPSQGDAATP